MNTKRCGRCHLFKDLAAFALKRRGRTRLQSFCRQCQHEYYTARYAKQKEAFSRVLRERTIRQRSVNRAWVAAYLREHPCVDCGIADIIVLEFDHVIGSKRAGVSQLQHAPASLRTVQLEVKKCVVRCANCHRRRTSRSWLAGDGTRWQDIPVKVAD